MMIRLAEPWLCGNEQRYVLEALDARQLSMGPFVARFEAAFAQAMGAQFGLATTSGTTALHLILAALNIGPGDEVIVPALTFVATANAVRYCGAEVVIADVDPETWCIDPDDVEARITSRTRAVIAVHLYGHPADMRSLREICDGYNLYLIEDAAEAPGALCYGQPVGSLGAAAAFSFYGNKIITCGEGGMVTTNDQRLADRLHLLRGQGQAPGRRYWHTEVGYNYRMTELQGAIGLAQVEMFAAHLAERRRVARQYQLFGDGLTWQTVALWAESACWLNVVLLPEDVDRDVVARQLERRGTETRPVFYPLAQLPAYDYIKGSWPIADEIARRGLCLPSHALLRSADVQTVCAALQEVLCGAESAPVVDSDAGSFLVGTNVRHGAIAGAARRVPVNGSLA